MGGNQTGRPRRLDKDIVLDRDDDGGIYASLPRQVRHYGVEARRPRNSH